MFIWFDIPIVCKLHNSEGFWKIILRLSNGMYPKPMSHGQLHQPKQWFYFHILYTPNFFGVNLLLTCNPWRQWWPWSDPGWSECRWSACRAPLDAAPCHQPSKKISVQYKSMEILHEYVIYFGWYGTANEGGCWVLQIYSKNINHVKC